MKILLFDMDGVLLEPHAYHDALKETVALVGQALGIADVSLTAEDIAAFEAAGVTSEWDSAAICAALLLDARWQVDPQAAFPKSLTAPLSPLRVPQPDFRAFVAAMDVGVTEGALPGERAWRRLANDGRVYTPRQRAEMEAILHRARRIEASLTMQVFQELILGSDAFEEIYQLPPQLGVVSYLQTRDRSLLSDDLRARLLNGLERREYAAAIMTNRPTRTPDGASGTPEGEAGARLVGLEALPMVGWGALTWVAPRYGQNPQRLCKPSPIHTLSALLHARGILLEEALLHAAALTLDARSSSLWRMLDGAEVWVYEDAVSGLLSLIQAREVLSRLGVRLDIHLVGISRSPIKRRALEEAGARLYASLAEGLMDTIFLAE